MSNEEIKLEVDQRSVLVDKGMDDTLIFRQKCSPPINLGCPSLSNYLFLATILHSDSD